MHNIGEPIGTVEVKVLKSRTRCTSSVEHNTLADFCSGQERRDDFLYISLCRRWIGCHLLISVLLVKQRWDGIVRCNHFPSIRCPDIADMTGKNKKIPEQSA